MSNGCQNILCRFNEFEYDGERDYNRLRTKSKDEILRIFEEWDNKGWKSLTKAHNKKEEFYLANGFEDSTSKSGSANSCDIQCKQSATNGNQDMEIEEASTSRPTSSAASDEGSNITEPIKLKLDNGINGGIQETFFNEKCINSLFFKEQSPLKRKRGKKYVGPELRTIEGCTVRPTSPYLKINSEVNKEIMKMKNVKSKKESSAASPPATCSNQISPSVTSLENHLEKQLNTFTNIKSAEKIAEDLNEDLDEGMMKSKKVESEKESSAASPPATCSNQISPSVTSLENHLEKQLNTFTNIKLAEKIAEDLNEDLDEEMMKSKKVESEKESFAASLPGTSFSQSLPSSKLSKELSHLTNEEESTSQPTSYTAIPPATFVQNPRCPKSKPEKFTKPDMSTIEKDSMNPSPSTANGGSVSSNVTNGKNYDSDSDYHEIKEPTPERTLPNILAQSLSSTSKAGNYLVIPDKVYARQRQFLAANEGSEMHVEESKGSLDSNQKNNISSDRKDNISSDRRDNIRSNRRDNIRSFASNYLSKMSCCKHLMFLPLTVIVVFSIAVYMSESQDRKHSSDFASAVVELKRIHGQDGTIFDLSKYLLSDTPRLKIITLIGGTGVGKSYTVEIIKKNFPRKYSIRQYFPPIRTGFDIPISFLQPGLIIMENLKERDFVDVAKIFKRYQDTYKDKLVTILAVFNFEIDEKWRSVSLYPSEEIKKMANVFIDEGIITEVRPFYYHSLDENALSMCIMDAMVESGLTLSENKFLAVKQSLIENNAGCKGAYNKVQIYGRQ